MSLTETVFSLPAQLVYLYLPGSTKAGQITACHQDRGHFAPTHPGRIPTQLLLIPFPAPGKAECTSKGFPAPSVSAARRVPLLIPVPWN